MDTILLIIHVTAAVVFVGPQVLMFYAVMPATWLIDDVALKRQVVSVVARRFGVLATVAIVTLLVTGLVQFYTVVPEPVQDDMMGYRFGLIFITKMTLFTLLVAMVLLHAMIFARRIRQLTEAVEAGEAEVGELERAQAQSAAFSGLLMLVSLAVLWLGVTLGHDAYAYVAVGG